MMDIFAPPAPKEKPEATNLTIRVPLKLKEDFEALCAKHNTNMTQVIRNFITLQLIQDAKKDQET